jgi:transposase
VRRAELFYQQLDALQDLRHTVRGELLVESRKHQGVKILRQIPYIGPLRAAQLVALIQTPQRFRSKRQLWTYSGLAVVTHDSAISLCGRTTATIEKAAAGSRLESQP